MSLELIGVDGLTLAHASGSLISGGSFVVTAVPSLKNKAQGKGAFSGPLAFTFSGGNAAGCTNGTVTGGGSIPPTAAKTKSEGLLVIRGGDSVTMAAAGTAPNGSPVSVSGKVEVSNAGQTKARAQ